VEEFEASYPPPNASFLLFACLLYRQLGAIWNVPRASAIGLLELIL
jgi:hypothetical protein